MIHLPVFRRLHGEAGLTVTEMAIGTALMMIVVAMTGSVLVNDVFRVSQVEAESRAVTELRTAVGRIERDVRSASCIYEPLPSAPGASQAGARLDLDTEAGAGAGRRVAYEVTADGELTFTDVTAGGSPVVLFEGLDAATRDQVFNHFAPDPYASSPSKAQHSRVGINLVGHVDAPNHSSKRNLDTVVTARNAGALAQMYNGALVCR